MDMPPIHTCVYLPYEHEQLTAKIAQLKSQIAHLEQNIRERHLDHSNSCSVQCQTDITPHPRPIPSLRFPLKDELHLQRLVDAQSELLRKHEQNALADHQQRLSPSPELIDEYERRLVQYHKQIEHAKRRAASAQQRLHKVDRRHGRMREKLSVLDDGFFDEVNDLKFAVQQATSLNGQYEKTIQLLSARLGITYPMSDT